MEIKKVTAMLEKVHDFLVWEYGYSGDRGNNGALAPVPRVRKRSRRDDLRRNQLPLGRAQHPAALRRAEPKAAAGDTEGPGRSVARSAHPDSGRLRW